MLAIELFGATALGVASGHVTGDSNPPSASNIDPRRSANSVVNKADPLSQAG